MESYLCSSCGRQVPSMNRLVHSAICNQRAVSEFNPDSNDLRVDAPTATGDRSASPSSPSASEVPPPLSLLWSDEHTAGNGSGDNAWDGLYDVSYRHLLDDNSYSGEVAGEEDDDDGIDDFECDSLFVDDRVGEEWLQRQFYSRRPSTWACSRCSLRNPWAHEYCELCAAPRTGMAISSSSSTWQSDEQPNSASYWTCSVCTLMNEIAAAQCILCDAVRPPLPSYRSTLLPPSTPSRVTDSLEEEASSPFSSVSSALVVFLGAGLGAALGMLRNRSTSSILSGAIVGAAGAVLLPSLLRAAEPSTPTSDDNSFTNLPLFVADADIHFLPPMRDGLFYEMEVSVSLFRAAGGTWSSSQEPAQRVDEAVLHRLPLRTYQEVVPAWAEQVDQCSICLTDYAGKDVVRVLPCSHLFHHQCIDRWLEQSTLCPVCKGTVA